MGKMLYIHIGAHKTGTTALQFFLSHNRKILSENGYLYPGNKRAHHDIAEEFRLLPLQQITTNKKNATSEFFKEIDKSNLQNIILSTEKFEILGSQVNTLKDFIIPRFQVKIIFYVRRQDERLESRYNAVIKNSKFRSIMTFSDFFSEFISLNSEHRQNNYDYLSRSDQKFSNLDYYSVLQPWEEAFGKDNILVRCYEDDQLPEGIFHDFLATIGLTLDDRYWIPKTRINESLSWDLIEVIRICNSHFKEDNNFHKFLLKNLKKINSGNNDRKQHLLSPQQRRDVISLFDRSNTNVAREFLGRSDGRLFYAPLPDLQEPWEPYKGLTAEKIVPIFTQMLFNIDNQKQKLDEQRQRLNDQVQKLKERSLKQRMMKTIKKIGSTLGLLPTMEYWYTRFHRT